jgi:formylglycine-generating enzyme required for sulfatase activity
MRVPRNERSLGWSVLVGVSALLVLVLLLVLLGQRSKSSGPAADAERQVHETPSAANAVRESQPAEGSEDLPDTPSAGVTAVLPDVQRSNSPASSSLSNAIQALSPTDVNRPPGGTNADLVPLELVWIPPGTFLMGSPEDEKGRRGEGPQTRVTLTRGFWMGRYEVTINQFFSLVEGLATPHRTSLMQALDPNVPIHHVSWVDAMTFCGRLTERERAGGAVPEGYQYRLPTEAEWEYACRAGTTTAFSFGSDASTQLRDYAWYGELSWDSKPQRVGLKKPNGWGLHDMHGNVGEWCLDWLGSNYPGGELVDPVGRLPAEGGDAENRVARGGCWRSSAEDCRSAWRLWVRAPNDTFNAIVTWGFRVVLGPVIEAPASTPDEKADGP